MDIHKLLKQYWPTIIIAVFSLIVIIEILVFFVIGDFEWEHSNAFFSSIGFMGDVLRYPIFISEIGAMLIFVLFPPKLLTALGLVGSGWMSLPTISGTIWGLVFYTLLVALINYRNARKPHRKPNETFFFIFFYIVLPLLAISLDSNIPNFLIFIPLWLVLIGIMGIKRKKVYIGFLLPIQKYQGEKAVKTSKILIWTGVLLELVFILFLVYRTYF